MDRIPLPEPHSKTGAAIREIIFGIEDGLISMLGIVLGVAGGTGSAGLVIIAGIAAIFAEAISMAAGAYLSTKAQLEFYHREMEREKREMRDIPEVERKEVRDIYQKKGFKGAELERVVDVITANKGRWLRVMMREELGLVPENLHPLRDGAVIGLAAVFGGICPLAPFFLLPIGAASITAVVVTIVALFGAGVAKTRVTAGSWVRSGLEMAIVGGLAAAAGFAIGWLLGVGPVH